MFIDHARGGACALLLCLACAPAQADNLDRALLDRAGPILERLNAEGHRKVGVLPFRVKRGPRPASTSAAPLAVNLPGRVENALIVTDGSTERLALRVLRDVSPAPDWASSRLAFRKLFDTEHPLAWGHGKAKADAFLTGEVSTAADRRSVQVALELVTPTAWQAGKAVPRPLLTFKVETDAGLLRDLGYAFALTRSAAERAKQRDQRAAAAVDREERDPKAPRVTVENVAGIRIEVEYDGVRQKLVPSKGPGQPTYEVPPPRPGQRVAFFLTRVSDDDVRLGAVLKLNGKSVYEEQDSASIDCRKWVYEPRTKGRRDDFVGYYRREQSGKLSVMRRFEVPATGPTWLDLDVYAAGSGEKGGVSTRALAGAKARTLKELQARLARANNLTLKRGAVAVRSAGVVILDVEPANAVAIESQKYSHLGGMSIRINAREDRE